MTLLLLLPAEENTATQNPPSIPQGQRSWRSPRPVGTQSTTFQGEKSSSILLVILLVVVILVALVLLVVLVILACLFVHFIEHLSNTQSNPE